MTDENRESLVRSGSGEMVRQSTSLVRRGLNLLEAQKPTEDATITELRERANAGDAAAQCNLGVAYEHGDGVPQDDLQAVQWFRKAAEQGQADAQCALGFAYGTGQGVPLDYELAVQWFRKAAERGQVHAYANLGVAYRNGQGVPQDYVEAHKWLNLTVLHARQSADQKRFADERDAVAKKMTPDQLSEAQKRAREWLATFEKRQK